MPQSSAGFRLAVLNPGGRDPEQHFEQGAGAPGEGHPPTNFHGYAACTGGTFFRDTARAIAAKCAVLLLLRGDFKAAERAMRQLKKAGRTVAVSLKETGLHQIASQLQQPRNFSRFIGLVNDADACIGATPEAADFYRSIRRDDHAVAFIPTPYPVTDERWNFRRPLAERAGIFIGTREFDVPSRNHLAALLVARELSDETGERVTVYNFDGRNGERLLATIGFAAERLRMKTRRLEYAAYVREIAMHKIVLQLDTSFVPGQVAGDALLARVPCVGGNGAIDRIGFPDTCGVGRTVAELQQKAKAMLTDNAALEQANRTAQSNAVSSLSFSIVQEQLNRFFTGLAAQR